MCEDIERGRLYGDAGPLPPPCRTQDCSAHFPTHYLMSERISGLIVFEATPRLRLTVCIELQSSFYIPIHQQQYRGTAEKREPHTMRLRINTPQQQCCRQRCWLDPQISGHPNTARRCPGPAGTPGYLTYNTQDKKAHDTTRHDTTPHHTPSGWFPRQREKCKRRAMHESLWKDLDELFAKPLSCVR